MATSGGPNTTTEGLVFGYDTGYPLVAESYETYKFNKGEPTENLVGNSTFIGTSGTQTQGVSPADWVFSGESDSTGFQFYNSNTSPIPLKFPNEGAVITTGPGDNSNRRIYFRRTDLLGNTTYSISCWMYFSRAFNSAWAKFQYDSSNTNVFSGYFDNFSTYASTHGYGLDEWFLWEGTFTTAATTEKSYWGPVISRTADVLVGMQRMQVEVKGHTTPFIQGTRSVSGSLIDLTRTNDIDLSNVSFDSNAQLNYDGTDDYLEVTDHNSLDLTEDMSFEFVVKADSTQNNLYPRLIDKSIYLIHLSQTSPFTIAQNITTSGGLRQTAIGSAFTADTWTHIVCNYDGQYGKIYVNGELVKTSDFSSVLACNTNSTSLKFGGNGTTDRVLNGELPIAKVYNKVLTAAEVKQNYNALKNRFNI